MCFHHMSLSLFYSVQAKATSSLAHATPTVNVPLCQIFMKEYSRPLINTVKISIPEAKQLFYLQLQPHPHLSEGKRVHHLVFRRERYAVAGVQHPIRIVIQKANRFRKLLILFQQVESAGCATSLTFFKSYLSHKNVRPRLWSLCPWERTIYVNAFISTCICSALRRYASEYPVSKRIFSAPSSIYTLKAGSPR